MEYPWYRIVERESTLHQGDLFYDCQIIVPFLKAETETRLVATARDYNVVVVSQSCDLENGKVDNVLVCPFWTLEEASTRFPDMAGKRMREKLRQGNLPGYHLLNKSSIEGMETDFLVVDFRNVYGAPTKYLEKKALEADRRLRLLPPYREHLAQAFARYFMRVGLPVDIPKFT